MNQGFKLRFDKLREGDPTQVETSSKPVDHEFYQDSGHTRNVCFVWSDEKRLFLNYAYLIAGEFNPQGEKNVIKLVFSSHTVSLQGYGLETLYMALLDHLPRFIIVTDPRYVLKEGNKVGIVTEIVVEKMDK